MTEPEQTLAWLDMLFLPDDIFEVRVKRHDESGAKQAWYVHKQKAHQFAHTLAPIHEDNERHVWIGVGPRTKIGSSAPALLRALWVDLDSSVTTEADVERALDTSGLPPPTMIVNSGNGFHLYWKLAEPLQADKARPWTKGVHQALPTDSTHDPTRVMRVPGTANFKDPENPKRCSITEYNPERVYELEEFPKAEAETRARPGALPSRPPPTTLSDEDFELFVSNWLDGQKHWMAVGVAGYLRVNLRYSEDQCLAEIERIHNAAGYEMGDNLRKVVADTYRTPIAKVAGTSKLYELGVIPQTKTQFRLKVKSPKKPRIELIDFDEDIPDQEFWVDGFVGPGLFTMWAAEPKTGKSFAAMQMGHALATGGPLWDFDTDRQKHPVLYFQVELTKNMVAQRARNMFGLKSVRNPKQFAMTGKPPQKIDLIQDPEVLTDLAEDYEVIIVDPISMLNSNDERSSHSVNEVLSIFDQLRANGKAVVLVHHTRKLARNRDGVPIPPTMDDVRGSGAWYATMDALALQYRIGEADATKVIFAYRAAPDRDPLTLYRMPHGGFTSDKSEYLATNPSFTVPLDS